jgi:signal transduction histidine kinase/ligand-binding sensor domain-containing protein
VIAPERKRVPQGTQIFRTTGCRHHVLKLWVFFVATAIGACSQTAQYHVDSWTTENGLPNNWIVGITQTHDGYLWLTTLDGVVRFDGVRVRVFNKFNTPGLTSNRFSYHALWEDRSGSLWMGTDGGLIRYRDDVFTTFTARDGLPGNHVTRIDEDNSGTLWIFTDAGVARWEAGHFIIDRSLDAYLRTPNNLNFDAESFGLWRLSRDEWQRFAYGKWSPLPLPPELTDPRKLRVLSITEDSQRRLWYRLDKHPHEYFCVRNGRLVIFRPVPQRAAPQVCWQDSQGRLWLSNHYGDFGFLMDGRFTPLSGIVTSNAFQGFEDREGNFWIATLDHGLYRVSIKAISILRRDRNLESNLIGPMWQDRAGNMWLRSGGFTKFDDGHFKTYYRKGYSHYAWDWANLFSSMYEDRDGSLLTVMWDGSVVRFKDGRLQEQAGFSGLIKGRIYGILRDRAGDLWLGGSQGLYRVRGASLTHYMARDGLPDDFVNVIYEDRAGTLWIGTKSGLANYSGGHFAPVAGLRGSQITVVYEDEPGVLWVGTHDDGLTRLCRGTEGLRLTRYTTEHGLYSNRAYQILSDDFGFLWLSCDVGLYRVRKQELSDFANGRRSHLSSTHFGPADGLTSQCNSEAQPMALKSRDGRLWFATQDGIAVVDTKAIPFHGTPPPVIIEECLLDRRPVLCRSGVRVGPRQRNLEINYTALSFVKSEQIHFRYKLEGLDSEWVEAATRRTAYYSHLPPGHYSFKVIAANSDGVWNMEGTHLLISVLPPFYRTWWFVSLLILAGAGAAAFVWQYRVSRLQRAYAAQQSFSRQLIASQESERKRIAGELHDSLGQQLLIIKNWAVLALNSLQNQESPKEPLDEISSTASHAVEEMRGIAYNLRPYQLEKLGLSTAIRGLVTRMGNSSNARFSAEIDEVDGLFSKEVEISIYRIVQEALNNTVKHSRATAVRVLVTNNLGTVDLRIEDNGCGFTPPDGTAPQQSNKGFGLLGIAERVRILGGRVVIQSAAGCGSTIQISLKPQGTA